MSFQCAKFKPSGCEGYLKLFLPPFTSRCPVQRSQQSLALLGATFESFYALIEYQCGECPALMLASIEPESQKTTLSLLGLKAIGDRSNFCGSDSTTEAVDERRCSNPFPFVLDDSERSRAEHKMLVGSLNAASKNTVSKGTQEKIAGLIITKNLKHQEKWELKVLTGRLVWLLMSPASVHFEQDMEENYDSVAEHISAMRSSDMPRDFLARLTRWFIPVGPGQLSSYQEFHKEGSILLKSRFAAWGPRKVKSNAHFFAVFRMIEEEVRESKDTVLEQLFVEIWKDRETFVEMMVENLKKIEEVEEEMTGGVKRTAEEMEGFDLEEPDDINEKVTDLLNRFDGKDLVFITKYFKVVTKNSEQVLAISHPRIQKRAGDLSYDLRIKSSSVRTDCAALTNLDSDIMTGRKNTGPAFCTLVPLKDLSERVANRVLALFDMEIIDNEITSTDSSQDFPFTQSQTEETLKVCQVCRFASRDKGELKEHMLEHHKCDVCGKYFGTEKELDHHAQDHKKVRCEQCNQFVRKDEMLNHKMNHLKLKTFGKKVVKAKAVKPVTGYGLWQKEERKKILEENPTMLYTDVGRELGKRWALVSNIVKSQLKKQADDFNKNLRQAENEIEVEIDSMPSTSASVTDENRGDVREVTQGGVETPGAEIVEEELANLSIEVVQPAQKRKKTANEFTECPLCEHVSESNRELANHMNTAHSFTQSTMISCQLCKCIFIHEQAHKKHLEEVHGQEPANQELEIVLVKMRTLAWPAVVIKRENEMIEVKMISDDTTKVIKAVDVYPFDINKIANTKNIKLKNAYSKAAEMLKK